MIVPCISFGFGLFHSPFRTNRIFFIPHPFFPARRFFLTICDAHNTMQRLYEIYDLRLLIISRLQMLGVLWFHHRAACLIMIVGLVCSCLHLNIKNWLLIPCSAYSSISTLGLSIFTLHFWPAVLCSGFVFCVSHMERNTKNVVVIAYWAPLPALDKKIIHLAPWPPIPHRFFKPLIPRSDNSG